MVPLLVLCLVVGVVAPPPQRAQAQQAAQAAQSHDQQQQASQNPHPNENAQQPGQKPLYEFAYSKYLEEVVKILESDPKFTERLKKMPEEDIKAGKIADQIDDLEDHVYDKLHAAKLGEIERLRVQIEKQIEADGGAHNIKMPEHLDVNQWEKFGKEDLRKLIQKTVSDMNEIDKQRRDDFKEYEMKKKAEEDHKLAQMNEEERLRAIKEAEEAAKRHNEHEKLKHPGSRDQLEEVWSETDHMDKDQFNPRTFFALHDLNGDGYWNEDELEALFQLELEKMYNETNPDDDPRERMEEMYRMREHVTNQMDKNGDRLISLQEFMQDTEAQTPNKDEGWKDLGQQQVYTDEELRKFEEEYAQQMGWGENAYQAAPPPIAHPAGQQPPQGNHINQQPPQQPPHQPVHQQPPQQVHPAQPVQPVQNHPPPPQGQPVQPQGQVHHAPIVDIPKDPAYGI